MAPTKQLTRRESQDGTARVDALAEELLSFSGLVVSSAQADSIIKLYNQLPEFDKQTTDLQAQTMQETIERSLCQIEETTNWPCGHRCS